jgi:nitrogen fixation NifU-like protein
MSMDRGMGNLDALYRDVILDHHRSPRNFEKLEKADVHVEGYNPLCGDRIEIFLRLENGKLHSAFLGEGCSICMSSASMMTEELNGKPLSEVKEWIDAFRQLMRGEKCPLSIEGDLESLVGVRQFPVRIKCALLPWTTLQDAIRKKEGV